MVTRVIRTEADRALFVQYVKTRPLPFTVHSTAGEKRTIEQNRLAMLWIKEAAEQLGDRTFEELRGECKLRFGVPILRAENDDFREKYDAMVRPMPYETKLALMIEPFDMPVTRLLTIEQLSKYLDAINKYFSEQGLALTNPDTHHAR